MDNQEQSLDQAYEPTVVQAPSGNTAGSGFGHSKLSPFHFNRAAFLMTSVALLSVAFLVSTVVYFLTAAHSGKSNQSGSKSGDYSVSSLSTTGAKKDSSLQVGQVDKLSVNGQLQVSNTVILAPTAAPTAPKAGQIYYDKTNQAPYYYNGSNFVSLAPQHVTSLGGSSGQITVDNTLTMVSNQLSISSTILQSIDAIQQSPRVSSLQGQTGDLTLTPGAGIGISGTTISNQGVLSLAGTANQINVSGTTGNLTIGLPQDIATTSSPSFAGINIGGNLAFSDGSGHFTRLNSAGLLQDQIVSIPDSGLPTDEVCLKSLGNCVGAADYIAHLGTLTGLTTSGNSGSASTPTLAVVYGSGPNTAVQGSVQLTCPSGAGNLTGGGTVITLGGGGTCGALDVINNPTFSGNLAVQGSGGVTVGKAGVNTGIVTFADGSDNSIFGHLQIGALTQSVTYNLPASSFATEEICVKNQPNCLGSGGIGGTGTAGTIPVFGSGGTSIANSVISQVTSGTPMVTIGGNLTVGEITATKLQGTGALNVTAGGDIGVDAGSHMLTLQGNASSTLVINSNAHKTTIGFSAISDGTDKTITFPDLSGTVCIQNTNCGFAAAGSGVTSVDTLVGALTINNSTGSGTAITINNAAADGSTKGIATFNSTNFSASAGVVNTIQNIATTSSVTFGSLTLGNGGNITLASNGTVFADNLKNADSTHDLTLDAGAKNIIFKTSSGDSFTFPTGGGTGVQTICTSGITCASGGGLAVILENAGGVQTVNGNLNAVYINKHSGTGNLVQLQAQDTDAFVIDNTGATTIKSATVSNTLSVNTIQAISAGSLTVGDTGHTFTLQGNSTSTVKAMDSGGSFTTSLGFGRGPATSAPTGNVSYLLQNDSTVLPGTYYVCTTAGNCSGSGGAITGSGSTGQIPIFTASGNIADSIIAGTSTKVTVAGDLDVGVSGHGTITLGVASSQDGNLVFNNHTNGNKVTIVPASGANAPSANVTLKLPNASGTFAVSAAGPLSLDANTGQISCPTCLTGGSGGGGAGVASLNTLTGALTIANAGVSGSTITLNDAAADGSTKGIAAFNASNFSAVGGVVNTVQDITTGATPTFNGAVLQGNNGLTLGKAGLGGQVGQIFFKDGSTTNTMTVTQNTLSGARTINIPDMSGTLVVAAGTNLSMGTAGKLDVSATPSFTTVSATGAIAAGSYLIGSNNINTAGTLTNVAYTSASNNTFTGTATFQGVLTVGAPGTTGTLSISSTGSTRQVKLQAANPAAGGDATIQIPSITGGTSDDVCLKTLANCTGNGSGGSNFINNSTTKQTNSNFYVSANSGVAASIQGASSVDILDLYAAGGSTPIAFVDASGNFTGVGGTFSGAVATANLTSSGTIIFSGLNSAGVVHNSGTGQLSTSKVVDGDLQAGTFTNVTGTGALTAGSIGGSFGAISTSNNITTTAGLQGNTVNATGTGAAIKLNGTDINTASTLSNVAYLSATGNQTFAGALTIQAAGGLTLGSGSTPGKLVVVSATSGSSVTITAKNRSNALDLSIPVAAGSETTDEFCLKTAANCVGTGGGVTTTTGATNAVARFTGATTLGIGKLYDNGTTVSVGDSALAGAGLFNVGASNQFQVSAAGAVTATGLLVKPATDSASLVQVQNATGTSLFTLDSTGGNLVTNPSFEANLSGWTNVNFQDTTPYSGAKSGLISLAAGGSITGNLNSNLATSTQYTLSFWYKRSGTSATSISVAYGGGSCSNSFNISNVWTQVVCTVTTGTGTYNSFTITNTSGTSMGAYFDIDAFRMEQGLSTGYHEGNLTLNNSNLTIQGAGGTPLLVAQSDNHQIAINESAPSQSSAALDVNGNVNVTSGNGYLINGANINTAGTLSNVAYLGQNQTFTGANTFNGNNTYGGTQNFKNTNDSTTAFKIQNASSQALFSVDTTGGNLVSNPGFENGSTTGWSGTNTVFTITSGHTGGYAGLYSLPSSGNLTGSFSSNLATSTQYTLSFWYKRTGTPASMSTSVAFGGGTCTPTLNSSGAWTQVTCTVTTGVGTYNSFSITNTSGSSDSTFNSYDDFSIVTGPNAVSWLSGTLSLGADSSSNIALNGTVNSAVLFKNAVNSSTAFQIQNAAGTSLLSADTSNMRLTVGSKGGTATAQLYITGQTPSAVLGAANGTGATNSGNSVAVQGRYAYVVSNTLATTNGLQIFDVSNPALPVNIKSVNTTATTGVKTIKIYGKYAYVAGSNGTNGVLEVFDISNPLSPTSVATQTFTAASNNYSIYAQGHYVYVAESNTTSLYVFDVSNPASIPAATSISVGSSVGPQSMYGTGRYLYLVNGTSANAFQVVDLSNPAAPTVVKTLANTSFGSGTLRSITVQGRYAYVGMTAGTMYTVDISDPTAANVVGSSLTVGSSIAALVSQSRYLYAISGSNITTIDISIPSAPVLVSGTVAAASPANFTVSGRYLYVSNAATSSMLQIFDLGGTYSQQLEAGGIETDTLSVRGASSFANDVSIQGALNVGAGLQVGGNVGFTTTATSGTGFAVNAAALTSGNAETINSGAGGLAVTTTGTSSTGLSVTANSQTSGNVLSVSSSSAAYSTGSLASISQAASYTTTSDATNLLNVSRSLTSNIATPGAISKYNSQAYAGVTTNQTLSFDAGTANYRALVVTATVLNSAYTGSGSWPVLTYGGVSLGSPVQFSTNSSSTTEYIYVLANNLVPTGTNNLIMTAGGQSGQTTLVAQSWVNVDQTTPVNSSTSGVNSGGTSNSITLPSTGATHVIVDGIATTASNGTLATTQTGQTSIYAAQNAGASYRLGSAGAVMGWQEFGGSWYFLQVGVDLNPASAPSLNVTGAVASFSSTCLTPGSSGCTDTSNILNLNQQFASASGAVLSIQNSGTGADIQLGSGKIDSSGNISLGGTSATSLTLGRSGVNTQVAGTLGVTSLSTLSGGATINTTANISGTVNINVSSGATNIANIGTGTSTGTINVGNSAAGQISIQSGTGTTIKGSTSTAFLVQTASGGNLFQVDAASSNITLNGQNSPNVQAWATGNSTGLASLNSHSTIVANGYMYVIGGLNNSGVGQSTVYYAKINANGNVGNWATTQALPNPRVDAGVTYDNGYIYVVGGSTDNTSTNASDTVYYAKVGSDGTLGSWQSGTSLTQKRWQFNVFTYNGYLYAASGTNTSGFDPTTVYYSKLSPSGGNGNWSTTTSLGTGVNDASYAVSNGYAYIVSGNLVQYAKLSPTGGVSSGSWSSSAFPTNRIGAGVAIMNGYIYIIGGANGATGTGSTFFAPITSTGALGSWSCQGSSGDCSGATQVNTTALPGIRAWFGTTPVVANGYIYAIGGINSNPGTTFNTMYYTSTARVQVNGSLDLVGSSNGNLNEAGSGGNLTAGNTRIIGSLDVQGAVNFAQTVNIGNTLNVGADANVEGTLTVVGAVTFNGTLSVTGMATFNGGITVNGHIITGGSTPTFAVGATNAVTGGTGSSCNVSGTDTIGTITFVAGSGTTISNVGTLCTITFSSSFGATPPQVVLGARDANGAKADPFVGTITGTTFTVANSYVVTAGQTYTFSYITAQ